MRRLLLAVIAAIGFALPAHAQQYDTFQTNSTVAVTNTFQQALPRNDTRHGCLIQNQGTHTMYFYFGAIANATLANSFQVGAGQSISCMMGGIDVILAQVSVTGTSGDAYVVSTQ